MGIGYAAINSITLELEGSAYAKLQEGIFITDVSCESIVDNETNSDGIKNFFGTVVNANITLDNTIDSKLTYKITLYNSTKSVYTYMGLNYDDYFYSNSAIGATVSGIDVGDKVLGKSYIDVYLTFSYVDGAAIDDGRLEAYLRLLFEKMPPQFSVIGNPVNWVNEDVTLEIVPTDNLPVDFYEYSFDGGTTWSTDLSDVDFQEIAMGAKKTITIDWEWATATDAGDTALGKDGNATITVEATLTAEQVI